MHQPWLTFTVVLALSILLTVVQTEGIIDVHLIPHSHCDPGWKETFEGYYQSKVSHILTNVVGELLKNSTRTFIWSEVSFFASWYDEQSEELRANVRKLVENKQLEFVGGGWVQHDEANPHYHQVIDQLTLGHQYLWDNFRVKPNAAWQIDPFGHSSLTPTVLASAGFDAVVLNRLHYATKKKLTENHQLEFLWHSQTRPELKLLAHVLSLTYSSSYDFEMGDLHGNIEKEGTYFAKTYVGDVAKLYRSNVIMLPWGDDFRFVAAERQFTNMDLIINYVNSHPELGVRVQYSSLSRYFEALQRTEVEFPSYVGDFFPYADTESGYWTGYYSTQPSLKLYSRQVDAVIRAADVALTLANYHASTPVSNDHVVFDTDLHSIAMAVAREESALIMHHDAITGTATSVVINDYMRRLNQAYYLAKEVLSDSLSVLLSGKQDRPHLDPEISILDFHYKKEHIIVLHNSLAWTRDQFYKLTVRSLNDILVTDSQGQVVPHQLIPMDPTSYNHQYHLYFEALVGPLATETYYLTATDAPVDIPRMEVYQSKATHYVDAKYNAQIKELPSDEAAIENEVIRVTFSATNGLIEQAIDKATNESIAINQDLLAYKNSVKSGAYLMSTSGPATSIVDGFVLVTFKGRYVQEARVLMNNGIEWQIRVYSTPAHVIEQDYTVRADSGHEVIVRYNTNIDDNSFYTDNGLEVVQREKADDVPEHNYYPGVSMAYVQSEQMNARFTVMNQYAMGVTSLERGTLELMLHRNLPNDDERGMGESNNDYTTVQATLWSLWHTKDVSEHVTRQLSTMLNNPMMALTSKDRAFESQVSIEQWQKSFASSYRPMKDPLPPHIFLATLQHMNDDNKVLLRFVNTAQRNNEGQLDMIENVKQLFTMDFSVLEERSLDGIGQIHAPRLAWKSSGLSELSKIKDINVHAENVLNRAGKDDISLGPCESSTFVVLLGETKADSTTKTRPNSTAARTRVDLFNQRKETNPGLFAVYLVAFAITAGLISSLWSSQAKFKKSVKSTETADKRSKRNKDNKGQ